MDFLLFMMVVLFAKQSEQVSLIFLYASNLSKVLISSFMNCFLVT